MIYLKLYLRKDGGDSKPSRRLAGFFREALVFWEGLIQSSYGGGFEAKNFAFFSAILTPYLAISFPTLVCLILTGARKTPIIKKINNFFV